MTLSANQPYFLPYFPYWQLIAAADTFLVSDDYAFMKGKWIPRNRILVNGRPQYFRIEVEDQSCHRLIKDCRIAPIAVHDKLRTLEMAYHKAPHFVDGYELAERILLYPDTNLAGFLHHSIIEVCEYLGITTRLMKTSDLHGNCLLRKEKRIYDFCRQLGADRYINAIGGQDLYFKEDFRKEGIDLHFICSEAEPYDQGIGRYVPDLSVIDAIMFNSRDALHERLGQYRLL